MTNSVRSKQRTKWTDTVLIKKTREETTSQETLRITRKSNYFRSIVFINIKVSLFITIM